MPGFKIMLQDDNGEYPHMGRALIFEGSMLVYDPQRDLAQWVPVRGMSGTLTMPELRACLRFEQYGTLASKRVTGG